MKKKRIIEIVIKFFEANFVEGHDDFKDYYCVKKEDWDTMKEMIE